MNYLLQLCRHFSGCARQMWNRMPYLMTVNHSSRSVYGPHFGHILAMFWPYFLEVFWRSSWGHNQVFTWIWLFPPLPNWQLCLMTAITRSLFSPGWDLHRQQANTICGSGVMKVSFETFLQNKQVEFQCVFEMCSQNKHFEEGRGWVWVTWSWEETLPTIRDGQLTLRPDCFFKYRPLSSSWLTFPVSVIIKQLRTPSLIFPQIHFHFS